MKNNLTEKKPYGSAILPNIHFSNCTDPSNSADNFRLSEEQIANNKAIEEKIEKIKEDYLRSDPTKKFKSSLHSDPIIDEITDEFANLCRDPRSHHPKRWGKRGFTIINLKGGY